MDRIESIIKEIKSLPIHEHAFMRFEDVVFSDEARSLCEKNVCGKFGKYWTCPPAVGSTEACKKKCSEYKHAFIFTTVNKLKNQYDMDGWRSAIKKHEKVTDRVVTVFRGFDKDLLALSTQGCLLCNTCTYPDAPCKHPDHMFPATEAYGILVVEQAKKSNIKYNNGENTVTYFSMIFFN